MVGIVLLGIFVLLLAFGAPIAVCLGMSSVGAILVQGAGKPLDAIMSVLPRLCSSASSKFVLLAIPSVLLGEQQICPAGNSVLYSLRKRDGKGRHFRPAYQSG